MLEPQKIMFGVWSKGYMRLWVDLYNLSKSIVGKLLQLIQFIISIIISPIVFTIMVPFAGPYYRNVKKNLEASKLKQKADLDK